MAAKNGSSGAAVDAVAAMACGGGGNSGDAGASAASITAKAWAAHGSSPYGASAAGADGAAWVPWRRRAHRLGTDGPFGSAPAALPSNTVFLNPDGDRAADVPLVCDVAAAATAATCWRTRVAAACCSRDSTNVLLICTPAVAADSASAGFRFVPLLGACGALVVLGVTGATVATAVAGTCRGGAVYRPRDRRLANTASTAR